eukprot:10595-Heterococcus_DN1.PRE.1
MALLSKDVTSLTGSSAAVTISETVAGLNPSIVGNGAQLSVYEEQAGYPRYSAQYSPLYTGPYEVAVSQLIRGGLSGQYFDNQWLIEPPALERVDKQINFNWGTGAITPYGRDYVSARWTGKLLAPATETYTINGSADDAFRVYLNHTLILDTWEGQGGGDARADVSLTAGQFADLVVEYREETGSARMQLMWSSYSTPPQVIPASALYYALPISGSPWPIDVAPGGATYPWTDATGSGLANATAGQPAEFVIQARDSLGNPLMSGDGTAFSVYLDGPGNVELGSDSIGPLVALGNGKFRVTYTATMAGPYKLYVQTASGMDIYCGLGQANKCSPFDVEVAPGAAVGSVSEAQGSLTAALNPLTSAVAGQTGYFKVQAKDAYGNNLVTGGDDVQVTLVSQGLPAASYRASVQDDGTGVYNVVYTVPSTGTFDVRVTINGDPVQLCATAVTDLLDPLREYSGTAAYATPAGCALSPGTLTVVHGELHEPSCTATGAGLTAAAVGAATSIT